MSNSANNGEVTLQDIMNRLDRIDNKLSNFIKFYLMTWMNVQERHVETQRAQEELKKAVGL